MKIRNSVALLFVFSFFCGLNSLAGQGKVYPSSAPTFTNASISASISSSTSSTVAKGFSLGKSRSRDSMARGKKILQAIAEAKRNIRIQDSILDFSLSPKNPQQGQKVVIFAKLRSTISEFETLVEGSFNSLPVALEQPSANLWVYDAGTFSEVRSHEFQGKVFVRNSAHAQLLKSGIQQLDVDIADLSEQIDLETDEEVRNQLIALRQEKVEMRSQLVSELENLKISIGTENFSFRIKGAPGDINFPSILSVSPNYGQTSGGVPVTIQGENFGANPVVNMGGLAATVLSASSTEIQLLSPIFLETGLKDVEVRFTSNNEVKNAILENGFYATNTPATAPIAKVQVVDSSIDLGQSAEFTSLGSVDFNFQPLAYEWRLVSRSKDSELPLNGAPANGASYQFLPDAPGQYVVELKVLTTTAPLETSDPVYAVVNVAEPVNHAPVATAGSISIGRNYQTQLNVKVTDADLWQKKTFFVTKQSSLGTATVSPTGQVTFTSATTYGNDSIIVTVVDSGSPALSSSVTIPVTVFDTETPTFAGNRLAFTINTQGSPVRVWLETNAPVQDSDGQVVDCRYLVNGVVVHGSPEEFCFAELDFPGAGIYPVSLTIEDNSGAEATLTDVANVLDTPIPTGKFFIDPLSGAAPLSLVADASASTVPGGAFSISNYRWRFRDGSGNLFGQVVNHTILNPGIYNVEHRQIAATNADNVVLRTNTFRTQVYVDETPPAEGSQPVAQIKNPSGRQKFVNQGMTFDATDSFDVNLGGSLVNYEWEFFGEIPNPTPGDSIITESFPVPTANVACLTVTNANGASHQNCREYFVVNEGEAPRAVIFGTLEGVAPFEFTLDASRSFDMDGNIASYAFWNDESGQEVIGGPQFNYTFQNPGAYPIRLKVTDNDGNIHSAYQTVVVNPANAKISAKNTKKSKEKKKVLGGDNSELPRESEKEVLLAACSKGGGRACFDLSKLFALEQNEAAANAYRAKACTLGVTEACGPRSSSAAKRRGM